MHEMNKQVMKNNGKKLRLKDKVEGRKEGSGRKWIEVKRQRKKDHYVVNIDQEIVREMKKESGCVCQVKEQIT